MAYVKKKTAKRSKKYTRSRYKRKRNVGKGKSVTLKRKVARLTKFMNQQRAVHTHRQRVTAKYACGTKVASVSSTDIGGKISDIETAMANLRYYDPGTNTLITADAASGTYNRDISVSIYRKFVLKNNYLVPVNLQVFSCIPRDTTNVGPLSLYNSGMQDQGNPGTTSALCYVSDCEDLKHVYNVKALINRVVMPGGTATCRVSTPMFSYTIATNDAHNNSYQKAQGGHVFLIRVTGTLGHDTVVTAEQGLVTAGVDAMLDVTYKFNYDAGKDLNDVSVNDASDTFTNGGQVGNRPTAAQQA
jgi:hypothetical protein